MEMVLYRTEDDNVTVSALIKDETIWMTQKAMAELFGIDKSCTKRLVRLDAYSAFKLYGNNPHSSPTP